MPEEKKVRLIDLYNEIRNIKRNSIPSSLSGFWQFILKYKEISSLIKISQLNPNYLLGEKEVKAIKKILNILTPDEENHQIKEVHTDKKEETNQTSSIVAPLLETQLSQESSKDIKVEKSALSKEDEENIAKGLELLEKAKFHEKQTLQAKKELIETAKKYKIGSRTGELVSIKTKSPEEILEEKSREKKIKKQKQQILQEKVKKEAKEILQKIIQTEGDTKYDKEKREKIREKIRQQQLKEAEEKKRLKVADYIPLSEFAKLINKPALEVQQKCIELGYPVSINQNLPRDVIQFLGEFYGYNIEIVDIETLLREDIEQDLENIQVEDIVRPPVVVVMGHVDHGKTTLLDYIRKTRIAEMEAGRITQHIGAYTVQLPNSHFITFIDTPGHEAFTAIRARGASVTDVAIIVIAADEGVMPQTIEALNHAKNAGVQILFAINKIDKPEANPEKVYHQLATLGYQVENWGGDYLTQNISAKTGQGVPELLDKIIIVSELIKDKLTVRKNGPAKGTVIEGSLKKGWGHTATLLIQEGTLKIGDLVIAGATKARVKAMLNDKNEKVKEAPPGFPIMVPGFETTPIAGDKFFVVNDEKKANEIIAYRQYLLKLQKQIIRRPLSLIEALIQDIATKKDELHQINVVLRADTDSSAEAIHSLLERLSDEKIKIKVIHRGVGFITESDVNLAIASKSLIIGFNVSATNSARHLAEQHSIDIRYYQIIYKIEEDFKKIKEGILAPKVIEKIIGSAQVRKIFNLKSIGVIAGCAVKDGKILRNALIRVIRDGTIVWSGPIKSLKHYKEDVKEVSKGMECGILLDGFNDIKESDILEAFITENQPG